MLLIEAIGLGLVIGLFLGALGGGGGVLVVPALVYVLGQSAEHAMTGSIIIVGLTAIAGTAVRLRDGLVDWRIGLGFGAVGIPAAYLGTLLNHGLAQPVLLLAFAVLTVVAALAMLLGERRTDAGEGRESVPAPVGEPRRSGGGVALLVAETVAAPAVSPASVARGALIGKVVVCGGAVGFLTGFLGVGGGFLVVPALVIALKMPMRYAVGTSLMVIVLNSVSSLVARVGLIDLDPAVLVPFTVAAIAASACGKWVADRLSGAVLSTVFAGLLLLVGALVGAQSLGVL